MIKNKQHIYVFFFFFKIFNGLFAREDWDTMCEIPVGAIPQGSGNGLARSLAHFIK